MFSQAVFFFLLSFIISLLFFTLLRKYSVLGVKKKGIFKRSGGIYFGLVFLVVFSCFYYFLPQYVLAKDFWSILVGILILSIGGVWDDIRKTNWLIQLIFQSSAALILILVGDTIDHIRLPGGVLIEFSFLLSMILAYFWIIIIINSLNWFDGIDGLTGSISFITLIILAVLSALPFVAQPGTVLICLITAGILLGFLFFNFRPAFLELGTTGVWILGFLIAVISIYSGGKVATTALVLGLPILNFIFVSLERILKGKLPVLGGDRFHLHERLEDKQWSNTKIVITMSSIAILWGVGALLTQTSGKVFLLFLLVGVFLFLGLIVRSKGNLLKKY